MKASLKTIPWSLVSREAVDISEGDEIFSRILVIRHCVLVKPLAPQYLRGNIGGANLNIRIIFYELAFSHRIIPVKFVQLI